MLRPLTSSDMRFHALQSLWIILQATLALRAIVACVESRRWHHGDLWPASLPADRRDQSDPSPAPRCRRIGRWAPTAAVDCLERSQHRSSVAAPRLQTDARCLQLNLGWIRLYISLDSYPTSKLNFEIVFDVFLSDQNLKTSRILKWQWRTQDSIWEYKFT